MTDKGKVYACLQVLNPSSLDYEQWLHVGMALESVGASVLDWDQWSKADNRYVSGDCEKKWKTFRGNGSGSIGIGTLCKIVLDQGLNLPFEAEQVEGRELSWDDSVAPQKHVILDSSWLSIKAIPKPSPNWNEKEEIITYLKTLFQPEEKVGYVTKPYFKEGVTRALPTRGHFDQSAEQLIGKLEKCNEIQEVLGDYDFGVGAWVRFNPLDGKDTYDQNVTAHRYALVESDELSIEKQYAIIKELELPVAILVHSGGKSLHAIVKVEASDYDQYRKRVDYLYKVLNKNGFIIDGQNKNPSRLSRLPGIHRGDQKQYIVDKNIGLPSWEEWESWIEDQNDDLPEIEPCEDIENPPDLAPELISKILREGHKMLLAGPSKAGKSFALIQLAIAIAEGFYWLGSKCSQGKVLIVNLEIDKRSFAHRLKDVYQAMGLKPVNSKNLDIWHLRGKSAPLDKLAPKLIRRALKNNYKAVIIDPIYKVITGDENSAEQMAKFCGQFDKICAELGSAVIVCHHHSKGSQGQKKSGDRASGSGVFLRDPDALIDLIELEIDEDRRDSIENKVICDHLPFWMDQFIPGWREQVSQDDVVVAKNLISEAQRLIGAPSSELSNHVYSLREKASYITGWRIEGTLREFPSFKPKTALFEYPIHKPDGGTLDGAVAEGEDTTWNKKSKKEESQQDKKATRYQETLDAFESQFADDEIVSLEDMATYCGIKVGGMRKRFKALNIKELEIIGGNVRRKK